MNDENKYGGPAFPWELRLDNGAVSFSPGMSLRDWFAGQALASTLASFSGNNWHNPNDYQVSQFAETAYRCADAMLKVRGLKVPSRASDVQS